MAVQDKQKSELDFISLLLRYKDAVEEWIESGIDESYFDKDHQLVLKAIKYAYSNDVLLTKKTYVTWLQSHSPSKAAIPSYEAQFVRILHSRVNRDDFPMLRDSIRDNYMTSHVMSYIEEFRKDNKDGRRAAFSAADLAKKLGDLVEDTSVEEHLIYESAANYADEFFDLLVQRKDQPEEQNRIKCGIREIDETMGVGFAPGEMTLFCADVGNYKTTIMLNVARNIWKRGYNVLFVPLEMPREMLYQKFLSLEARVDFDKLVDPFKLSEKEWTVLEEKSKYIKKQADNQFYIMEKPGLSVSNLKRAIEKHVDIFKPHVVVIDYIGLMLNEDKRNQNRHDLQIGDMLKSLRRMGMPNSMYEHGFHTVSGVHIGRDALKRARRTDADKVGFFSEDLSQSSQYSNDATNIYAQIKDASMPDSRLNFYCIKSRFGKTTFKNGENRTVLSVRPSISLIESINDEWMRAEQKNMLEMSEEVENMTEEEEDEMIGSDFDLDDLQSEYEEFVDRRNEDEVLKPHNSELSCFDEDGEDML